jgi:hypothetical protein
MKSFFIAAALLAACSAESLSANQNLTNAPRPGANPTMNLSAVRHIACKEGNGSGFMIDDDTMVTALHVLEDDTCWDADTRSPLKMTYSDKARDFAIVKGNLPNIPVVQIDCGGFKPRGTYWGYGYSTYGHSHRIFRQQVLTFGGVYTDKNFHTVVLDKDGKVKRVPMPGMAWLKGYITPGTSGGYVGSQYGYAVGYINAGTTDVFGLMTGDSFSYELKNTILCQKPAKSGR